MKDIKLYIEVVFYRDGTSSLRVVRKYVTFLGNTKYDIVASFKNNFLGKIRAKMQLAKWKKYHELHDFSDDNGYSIIEETIY